MFTTRGKIFAKIEWKDTSKNPTAAAVQQEVNHSIRPVPEREQADRADIESDQFIQASPHDSGWAIG